MFVLVVVVVVVVVVSKGVHPVAFPFSRGPFAINTETGILLSAGGWT